MKNKLKRVLKDTIILRCLQIFLILMAVFMAVIVWKWQELPPELPLFYSLPRSEDVLGTPYTLLILPVLSIVIFMVHLAWAAQIYEREMLTSRILAVTALTVGLILLITFLRIIFLIS
ncbi:MAG: hypothetical protein UV73_C0003G0148 [Candidatus Gottesmanbacteria bacterium GW2011_GWA2_43_14]|uniref:DUF1648 domain-containing protein n=1 Tax=Candidatus Gottesmanbacteria bacterium GW2011_GWA2_43_14 TaxID=1618443 RepID=A0A0G1FT63_9BACT|nr:MAG: hypothetical protein UV73_C0003G0148 [Candidatus Gottesmanbacteria bacterium GW2011_GWA2_43_14]